MLPQDSPTWVFPLCISGNSSRDEGSPCKRRSSTTPKSLGGGSFPCDTSSKTGSTANVKHLPTQSLACRPLGSHGPPYQTAAPWAGTSGYHWTPLAGVEPQARMNSCPCVWRSTFLLLGMGVGVLTPQVVPLRMEMMETTSPGLHSPPRSHVWVIFKLVLLQFSLTTLRDVPGNTRRASFEVGTNSVQPGLAPLLTTDNQRHRTRRMIPYPQFWLF